MDVDEQKFFYIERFKENANAIVTLMQALAEINEPGSDVRSGIKVSILQYMLYVLQDDEPFPCDAMKVIGDACDMELTEETVPGLCDALGITNGEFENEVPTALKVMVDLDKKFHENGTPSDCARILRFAYRELAEPFILEDNIIHENRRRRVGNIISKMKGYRDEIITWEIGYEDPLSPIKLCSDIFDLSKCYEMVVENNKRKQIAENAETQSFVIDRIDTAVKTNRHITQQTLEEIAYHFVLLFNLDDGIMKGYGLMLSGEPDDNAILTYCYIDDSQGVSFRGICSAKVEGVEVRYNLKKPVAEVTFREGGVMCDSIILDDIPEAAGFRQEEENIKECYGYHIP